MDAPMTLWVRDLPGQKQATDVKNTFSSWDACMQKDYCKWPVIVVIVVVSLIVLSVVFCLVRCLCCGLECCCGCFSCLNSCCSCCQPRRRRWGDNSRYKDEPFGGQGGGYNPHGGYQTPAPPVYVNVQAPPAQRYEPSRQYASFDSPAKRSVGNASPYRGNDDALPAMPSWKDSQARRVEHEEEEVEMDHLNHAQQQKAPMLANQARAPSAGPTPSAQTPGQGLYNDDPTHTGDLGDGYGHHDHNAAYAGAAGAVAGVAAGGAAAAYYGHQHQDNQQGYHQDPYNQHDPHQGYVSPQQTGVTGYGMPPQQHPMGYTSPPPQHGYVSPPPAAGAAYGAPQHTASPPPTYHTGPVSPIASPQGLPASLATASPAAAAPAAPAGLPSSLTPGNQQSTAFQPPVQQSYAAYGSQQTGVSGGAQGYSSYQPHGQPQNGTWHDV